MNTETTSRFSTDLKMLHVVFRWFCLLYFLGFMCVVAERLWFVHHSLPTVGTVTSVSAKNERCGGLLGHDCTKFTAYVRFPTSASGTFVTVPFSVGGKPRWHNRGIEYSDLPVGMTMALRYSISNPTRVYRDTLVDIWFFPAMFFIFPAVLVWDWFIKWLKQVWKNAFSAAL